MKNSQLDIYTKFSNTQSLGELWMSLHSVLADYGISSIFYGFTHSLSLAMEVGNKEAMFYKSSHPAEYDRYYTDKNYHFINDCVSTLYCGLDTKPFLWHDTNIWWDTATDLQKVIYRESEEFNLKTGVSLPVRFGNHGVGGIGLAASDLDATEFNQLWSEHEKTITEIAYCFDVIPAKNT